MVVDNKIKFYRKKCRVTQVELSKALCVSKNAISSYERNDYIPSLEIALRMALFFNCSVEDLFELGF